VNPTPFFFFKKRGGQRLKSFHDGKSDTFGTRKSKQERKGEIEKAKFSAANPDQGALVAGIRGENKGDSDARACGRMFGISLVGFDASSRAGENCRSKH